MTQTGYEAYINKYILIIAIYNKYLLYVETTDQGKCGWSAGKFGLRQLNDAVVPSLFSSAVDKYL